MTLEFDLACPLCKTPLAITGGEAQCPQDGQTYRRVDGIWQLLRPDRAPLFAQFIHEYETIRTAEGRGSNDPAYYRALPFADLSGKMTADWAIRAQSFTTLLEQVIRPLENRQPAAVRPLRILDLGAGNSWLSYRLAKRGHHLAAVDLTVNHFDGLGAHTMYDADFLPIQAEFDHLPFTHSQVNLVIFNASLHYSADYAATLREAWRVAGPGGVVAVVDTPLYHDPASGAQMVREREAQFQERYGFPSNALPNENYLTYRRLDALAAELGLRRQLLWPVPRWRWAVRRLRTRLRGRREPAQFPLIVLRREDGPQ
ncbi:MAG: methyltransferase domain-containing protein [Anaerolineae bacterium]